ncbi:MAG: ChrR family anti-sigma-E factor [Xanthobacteraceae bacterium]
MTRISHHIPDNLLSAYATGNLAHSFSVLIAAHLSLCDECRANCEAVEMIGGALLDAEREASLSSDERDRLFRAIQEPPPKPPLPVASKLYPAPVMDVLKGQSPTWKMLGGGIRQQILLDDSDGSLRLLYIPSGCAVPEHGHRGPELTLVLQGSFSDHIGRFQRGDVEYAHDDINHQPIADLGEDCICLAATDAPLRFRAILPRLLQPLFRI